MSDHSVGRARSRSGPSFSLTRRRTRLVAVVGAAALALALPVAAAQATTHDGAGTTPGTGQAGHHPTSYPNPFHKFSQAALEVGCCAATVAASVPEASRVAPGSSGSRVGGGPPRRSRPVMLIAP